MCVSSLVLDEQCRGLKLPRRRRENGVAAAADRRMVGAQVWQQHVETERENGLR